MEKQAFVIFGGTGNLTYQKLIPSLYELEKENALPKNIKIYVIGRREKTQKEYDEEIRNKLTTRWKEVDNNVMHSFQRKVFYLKMDYHQGEDYKILYKAISKIKKRTYYFATAPADFVTIAKNLKAKKLIQEEKENIAVFEKPFGNNLLDAIQINKTLSNIFKEENIYRIDHYLGKEMVQNIKTIRFSNQIFDAVWNNKNIDNIQINIKEKIGIEERGGYYDQSGALKDMVQNHLFQILAFLTMEEPKTTSPKDLKNEKVKILKKLRIPATLKDNSVIFGQYKEYQKEPKVKKDSDTETFVAMKCMIQNRRWKGVPIYIRTGKYLNEKTAEAIIEFKTKGDQAPDLLIIKIQPEEGISLVINSKEPGLGQKVKTVNMEYCQTCSPYYNSKESYERLLLDAIKRDSTLFARWDEVYQSWKLVDTLIRKCPNKKEYIKEYNKGSNGPVEADTIFLKKSTKWWESNQIR